MIPQGAALMLMGIILFVLILYLVTLPLQRNRRKK